jgi:hypothetical protein
MKSRRRIIKSFVFVGLVLVFALSLVSQSGAQNKQLKGVYAVVGQSTCVTSWSIFPTDVMTDVRFVHSSSAQGTITFNGDGTGSGRIYSVDVTHPIYTPIPQWSYWPGSVTPPYPPIPSISENVLGRTGTNYVDFQFTYTVAPDGAISRTIIDGTFVGKITSGPSQDKFFTNSVFTLTGFVSKDKGTILLSSFPGQEEKITVDIYDDEDLQVHYGQQERQCHRSRVLTLISK